MTTRAAGVPPPPSSRKYTPPGERAALEQGPAAIGGAVGAVPDREAIDRRGRRLAGLEVEAEGDVLAVDDGGGGTGRRPEGDRLAGEAQVAVPRPRVGAGGDEDGVAGRGGVDPRLDRGLILRNADGGATGSPPGRLESAPRPSF